MNKQILAFFSVILTLMITFSNVIAQNIPSKTNIQINLSENDTPVNGAKSTSATFGTYNTTENVIFTNGLGILKIDLPLETLKNTPNEQLQITIDGENILNISPESVLFAKVALFAYEAENAKKIGGNAVATATPEEGTCLLWKNNKWTPAKFPKYTAGTGIKISEENQIDLDTEFTDARYIKVQDAPKGIIVITPENLDNIEVKNFDILKLEGKFTITKIRSKLNRKENITVYGGTFEGVSGNNSSFETGCRNIFKHCTFKNVDFGGCGDTYFLNCKFEGNIQLNPDNTLMSCDINNCILKTYSVRISHCKISNSEIYKASSISKSTIYNTEFFARQIKDNNISYSTIIVNDVIHGDTELIISNNFFRRCKKNQTSYININNGISNLLVSGNYFDVTFENQYIIKTIGIDIQFLNNYCREINNAFQITNLGSFTKVSIIGNIFREVKNMGLQDNGSNIRFLSNLIY